MNTINKAYIVIGKNKKIKFEKIWKNVKESKYSDKENEIEAKNNLYTELLIDHRFIMIEENEWSLREFYSIEEIQAIMHKNYDVGEIEEKIEQEANTFVEEKENDVDSSFEN